MRKLAILIIAVIAGTTLHAQALIGLVNFQPVKGFNKQVQISDTAKYRVTVQNKGNQPYSGNLNIRTEIDTGQGFLPFQLDSFFVQGTNPIAVGDTASFALTVFPYADTRLTTAGQGNIVVIWPMNGVDSFIDTFWISINTGMYQNPALFDQVALYPIPTSHKLNLTIHHQDMWIERVRMYDLSSRLVLVADKPHQLSLEHLMPGTYILEVALSNGQKGMYQIIKK